MNSNDLRKHLLTDVIDYYKPTAMNKPDTRPVKYSLIIDVPSADLDKTGQEIFHATCAARDIRDFRGGFSQETLPDSVLDFLVAMEKEGAYRVEIIAGSASYKMYIMPPKQVADSVGARKCIEDSFNPEFNVGGKSYADWVQMIVDSYDVTHQFVENTTLSIAKEKNQPNPLRHE